MPDYYHVPALILTALLLPAFGYLYLRFRDTRTLLWFLGFLSALFSMVLLYTTMGAGGFWGDTFPWLAAAGQTFNLIGTALFLGSLSPQRFRLGRYRVLYVVPYVSILGSLYDPLPRRLSWQCAPGPAHTDLSRSRLPRLPGGRSLGGAGKVFPGLLGVTCSRRFSAAWRCSPASAWGPAKRSLSPCASTCP